MDDIGVDIDADIAAGNLAGRRVYSWLELMVAYKRRCIGEDDVCSIEFHILPRIAIKPIKEWIQQW